MHRFYSVNTGNILICTCEMLCSIEEEVLGLTIFSFYSWQIALYVDLDELIDKIYDCNE
jgi:hypothetical protein